MANWKAWAVAAMVGTVVGCRGYESQRPPVDQLDKRDRGLQSKDVVDASDTVAQYLLQIPDLNDGKRHAVVVTKIENKTTHRMFNYDIFIQRLRTNLGQHGRDRIMLIENRQRVTNLRNEELEGPADDMGQGGGTGGVQGSVQPEFALYGIISNLPNRGTDYFLCEFSLTNLKTREQIPLKAFETKVAR